MSESRDDIKKPDDIKELIDNDEGLKSKRRLITVSSLILLGMMLSGAKVVEANTFILKVTFSHQEGLAFLLVLAVMFLLIRYYNYARPYHEKLYKLWSARMMREPFFLYWCVYGDVFTGLITEVSPEGFAIEDPENHTKPNWGYKCRFPLLRYIVYELNDEYPHKNLQAISLIKNISVRKYLKVLGLELKHRLSRLLNHRENLDILTPYILGVVAIFSYFLQEEFRIIMKSLLG